MERRMSSGWVEETFVVVRRPENDNGGQAICQKLWQALTLAGGWQCSVYHSLTYPPPQLYIDGAGSSAAVSRSRLHSLKASLFFPDQSGRTRMIRLNPIDLLAEAWTDRVTLYTKEISIPAMKDSRPIGRSTAALTHNLATCRNGPLLHGWLQCTTHKHDRKVPG